MIQFAVFGADICIKGGTCVRSVGIKTMSKNDIYDIWISRSAFLPHGKFSGAILIKYATVREEYG